jgi:hypothetical protein
MVKSQNAVAEAPDSKTSSKNRNDWVKKMTDVRVIVTKIVAISRFLKM